jgi:hypothetical protein
MLLLLLLLLLPLLLLLLQCALWLTMKRLQLLEARLSSLGSLRLWRQLSRAGGLTKWGVYTALG